MLWYSTRCKYYFHQSIPSINNPSQVNRSGIKERCKPKKDYWMTIHYKIRRVVDWMAFTADSLWIFTANSIFFLLDWRIKIIWTKSGKNHWFEVWKFDTLNAYLDANTKIGCLGKRCRQNQSGTHERCIKESHLKRKVHGRTWRSWQSQQ